jgi:hypothetical protein
MSLLVKKLNQEKHQKKLFQLYWPNEENLNLEMKLDRTYPADHHFFCRF